MTRHVTHEKGHAAVALYMGFQDEVATNFVDGQSLDRLEFDEEQRPVDREWAKKSESPTNRSPHRR
jgi:hypothetical protein